MKGPGGEAEHLYLAFGQPGWPLASGTFAGVSSNSQDRIDSFGIEPTCRSFSAQALGGGLGRQGRAVGPFLGQGLVHVRHRHQARAERNHRGRIVAIVTGAVQALVMHACQGRERRKRRRARQNAFRVVGMQPDLFPLGGRQRPGFIQDAVWNAGATEVVQQRGPADVRDLGLRQAEHRRRACRQPSDTGGMAVRPRRFQV
ncbi:MAG: hypothetical protein M3451_01415, partial [Chloroflexota bacterium]|nr:hypothetical protein [Chloroflexota bacterium]